MYDLSDHLPNFLIINTFSSLSNNFESYRRDFSSFNESNFLHDVQAADWIGDSANIDVNSRFDTFYSVLSNLVDKHFASIKMSKRQVKFRSKPWISSGIRKSLKIKNNFYKKFIKTKSVYYHTKFKLYRNKLNHLTRISKINYYKNYFRHNKSHIKNIWKGIKQIISLKSSSYSIPSKILVGNNPISDVSQIANSFNVFFTNIGKNLSDNVMETATSPMTFMSGCQQVNSFFFNYISASEISAEISNLKTSKSCGPFSVPIKILKLIRDHVSVPLEAIFNCSISTGTVPDKFKIANVIPVQGSHLILNNYRPISLLSVFSGLLERLVCRKLMNFITKYNLLYDKQFGLRSNHSTLFAVLSITDKIQKAMKMVTFIVESFWTCLRHLIL